MGKGIIASSVGLLLKTTGLTVTYVKIDPYLNQDAGTMHPIEYVLFSTPHKFPIHRFNFFSFFSRAFTSPSCPNADCTPSLRHGEVYVTDDVRRTDALFMF